MEMRLKIKDIEKILKKEFGDETEIIKMEDNSIIIDIDVFSFQKPKEEVRSDSSFREEKRPIQSRENKELSPEQERYIRMEMAKYGATGKDYAKAAPMKTTGRSVERYSGEKIANKSNTIIDRKSKSIIDGVN